MSGYFALDDDGKNDLAGSLSGFCRRLLEQGILDALLVAQHLPDSPMVQHTLVRSPDKLAGVDPTAPVLPVNGGVLAARLTRQDPGGKVGAVLRPCEIRAFLELVKLHQGDRERIFLIGMDCMGTFEPPQYRTWAKDNPGSSGKFLESVLGSGTPPQGAPSLRRACQACEFPTGEGADVQLLFVGTDRGPCLFAGTEAGETALKGLSLKTMEEQAKRPKAVETWIKGRIASRDQLFKEVESELLPMDRLLGELSSCIRCYNCREVCPVCYCKSCVFESNTFEHASSQYLKMAKKRGVIRMPTDSLFFHLTRMVHMSTSCVGCGQCSSACPMGIRVSDIFRTVGRRTQSVFEYVPGRSLEEPLPITTFREDELTEKE
ncbi:MAG: formate dehydrogenase [Deltaproteobacteria bacterium HGW-Deltaproteobacteria-15]|jgi:formate dehydrogenase subunit beta|nr:MAG: formate dehydrogenase [Deltaproteobacteria bacterium HGW-Deltaproteobacteria-15]